MLGVNKHQHIPKSLYTTAMDLTKENHQLKIGFDEHMLENKIRKIIVPHYPLYMALSHFKHLNYVVSAKRCEDIDTIVILIVKGQVPKKLDLGIRVVFQHSSSTIKIF